jgi:uncharacterized protein YjeT (DUF2065 family)
MVENKNVGFLKTVLMIYAVVCILYGMGYFLVPSSLVKLAGETPVFNGWLRWSGGVLIALGIGAILVYLNPKNQGIFVTTITVGCLLCGLGLLWAWILLQEGSNAWFTALPTIVVLTLAVLLWIARVKAKEILYPKQS